VRATIVPVVAIPVSIVGAFTLAFALGFTINILTLLALVLAIGLVVDDAIVVLENIYRHRRWAKPPLAAAYRRRPRDRLRRHRHHHGAGRGVHAGRLPDRQRGPPVPRVRHDAGRRRGASRASWP
jgi:hypothetical protein